MTRGFTGADLASLANEATLVATRRNAATVTPDDFTAAIERIVAGLEKKSQIDRAVSAIAQAAIDRAMRILSRNRTALEEGARALLQKETCRRPTSRARRRACRKAADAGGAGF